MIVLVGYGILGVGLGVPAAFAAIAVSSFVVTVLVYDLAVRRWAPVRPLFGMKARPAGR